jgi:hypothetical protein
MDIDPDVRAVVTTNSSSDAPLFLMEQHDEMFTGSLPPPPTLDQFGTFTVYALETFQPASEILNVILLPNWKYAIIILK